MRYILDRNKNVIPCDKPTWDTWHENPANRLVSITETHGLTILTHFMTADQSFLGPELFETRVFGSEDYPEQRCATWDQAVRNHKDVLSKIKSK